MRKLGRSCVLLVCFFSDIVDHGGCRGNMVQALAQWQHLVALHEATGALHRVMHPALHRRIRMAINFASNLPAFFVVSNFIVGHNRS
jgi:hypothetical protein